MLLTALLATAHAAPVDRVPEDFATVQEAIDQGTAPEIRVGPGHWQGAELTRPVRLVGEGAIITRGIRSGGERAAFVVPASATGSTIEGFVVDCASSRGLDLGVLGSARRSGDVASQLAVRDNAFLGCAQGVTNAGPAAAACTDEPAGGAYWVVEGNTFHGLDTRSDRGTEGGGVGVLLYNARGADVHGNTFSGRIVDRSDFATAGISLAGCVDCTVSDNRFTVEGGAHFYTAVSNAGARVPGAVASRNLLLVDNDATGETHPWLDVAYRSRASVATILDDNTGVAYVDHEICGDGELYVDLPMPE